MQWIIAVTALFLIPGLILTWFMAGSLVAAHPQVVGDAPADLPAISISLYSESGSCLAGWHIRSSGRRGVIVLVHPYRGCRLVMVNRARLLHSQGYSVVMVDLRAHGESSGSRVTIGYLERHDVKAAVEFARTSHPNESIGVIGFSMGGVATLLASPLHVDTIILESVYPDICAAVTNRVRGKLGAFSAIPILLLLVQLKPRLRASVSDLRPIDRLPEIDSPVLIMSGTGDRYTTEADTKAMFNAAVAPKELWLIEDAGHEDLYEFVPRDYEKRLLSFLKQHLPSAVTAQPA